MLLMRKDILTVEEMLVLNEMMLGRGMPVQEDGIGYNKADYGICSNYYYGLSDVQIADLAKRLVKYSKTQLGLDREIMKETAKHYESLVNSNFHRTDGVTVNVTEDGTHIAFKYNERFIAIIQAQPKRKFDPDHKQWIVPNSQAKSILMELKEAGADVDNAINYILNHPLCKPEEKPKVEVRTKHEGSNVLIKFDYNKDIVDAIKEIDRKDRNYNPDYKFWSVNQKHFDLLKEKLSPIAYFKAV